MLDHLSERLSRVVKTIRGQARLTEANIQEALREVRIALLEADVALPVVKDFIDQIKQQALGHEVMNSLTPGQVLVEIVHKSLTELMGKENSKLNLAAQPPAVILMAGLQGAGKTTTVGKLAKMLREDKKKILLVSCDVYRPAAIEQLRLLASQVGVDFFSSSPEDQPELIARESLLKAQQGFYDVLLVDSAGRLSIDEAMMKEIQLLHHILSPVETLFVVDSMQGQDAVNTAKAFNEALPLTGIVLTKMDGDARGGAALSVRSVTGKPIKFLGVGEKLEGLEAFHPERMASRILGMGDVLSLIEDVRRNVDEEQARKIANKVKQGGSFDFNDFKAQIQQMRHMGGVDKLMDKMPKEFSSLGQQFDGAQAEKKMVRTEAIINSMTPKERKHPDLIKASRKRRIALGSGVSVQEVNQMIKQFEEMQKMMKMFSKGGMGKALRAMQRMVPSGFPMRGR
jgi:signal recognition particle subunit SRP54